MGEADEIPVIDFCGEGVDLEEGSGGWKGLSSKVREACETHGCFLLMCNKIPMHLREQMFTSMKTLFDLPEDTKKKYTSPRPYNSYESKSPVVPLHESFGIDDAPRLDAAQAFTNLIWPDGNPGFCEILNSMSSKMLELNFNVLKMIFESFGTGEYYDSHVENSTCVFRVMKYKFPPTNDSTLGLIPHTDKNALTILCQNEVQGLEVLSKEGNWIQVMAPEGSFTVIVGDGLKAWSNGRLHAPRHRVMMSGDKDRYSCGLFLVPKDGVIIEVPQELIDKEHPLLYRPFTFADYLSFFVSNLSEDALETYAGV